MQNSQLKFRLGHGKLAAAKALSQRVQSSKISIAKTPAILGISVDVTRPSADADDPQQDHIEGLALLTSEHSAEGRQGVNSDDFRMLRRTLRHEAKAHADLEALVNMLHALEMWGSLVNRPRQ